LETQPKYFSHPSFTYVLFCNPTNKTETRTANRWETTNSKQTTWTNHYDEPIRNTEQQLDHIYYTVFLYSAAAVPRTSHDHLRNYDEAKPFSGFKPVQVGFSSSICTVQDHILSTAGNALRTFEILFIDQN